MSKVVTPKLDSFVNTLRRFTLLFTLRFCQSLFIRAEEARVGNLFARRKSGKVRQASVNPNASIIRGQWLRFHLHREARIPFACCRARDGQSLDLALQRTVKFDFDFADFRERQLIRSERETGLRVGERIVSLRR